ncbi:MAG TPA: UDP-N-acetylglucosamine--N-acetylmuramyl-(pentapeptide) pyrophosphoryl-undecaprenol N-acetylglucosamine transferase [Terrimesophilobacter sp.]|nr:UDP-N-acetylglucosamine--N-acetylmuramyl-(pentapeptide) pyrophosphoryl-undecaprenol N-acetylglucosamine transferase [Terrimesophilobacter sp.]
MTRYLLAGGGTAGHVNPLLAVAERLRSAEPESRFTVLGTADGLEARLVPARGFELVTIEKVPLPRRPGKSMVQFPGRFRRAVGEVRHLIADREIDVVVGFGGFVSAPAYLAAWREKRPIVVHEANAVPGFANRLGSWLTRHVGVAFEGTRLRNARFVGMPLSSALEELDPAATRHVALRHFGFDETSRVLLVTGGSLGARSINNAVSSAVASILGTGWSVLHIIGNRSELGESSLPGYRVVRFCDRMDLAFSAAQLVVSRAGAATVSEITALGIPAVYVPLPIGNGEQRRNAAGVVAAGGALLVANSDFTPSWIEHTLIPLLLDPAGIAQRAANTAAVGVRDGTARTVALVMEAAAEAQEGSS